MKERPILFSGPMVRAILAGRKRQTRRVLKCQPVEERSRLNVGTYCPTVIRRGEEEPGVETFGAWSDDGEFAVPCPFGQPGDRLWVREMWSAYRCHITDSARESFPSICYHADSTTAKIIDKRVWKYEAEGDKAKWRPSIHMPRWASRLTLEITDVRAERLQAISDADGVAEGYDSAESFLAGDWASPLRASNPWLWAITCTPADALIAATKEGR